MTGKNVLPQIESLIRPALTGLGVELYDMAFVREGSNWYLRVFIDKRDGVTIDDCEAVSRAVEKILDENDPIEQSYILEVSSPGIDRPLKKDSDYEKYKGSAVDLKLYKPVGGHKDYSGKLAGLADGNIIIADDSGNEISFPKSDVALCRLAVTFH